jgi:regulator of protease activity HflC (stomatin/prohibitin superfamily)
LVSREFALFAREHVLSLTDEGAVMPPILLSPLVKWTLVAVGGAMVVHWVVKEVRRINQELDAARRVRITDKDRGRMLRRDPVTGEYRL